MFFFKLLNATRFRIEAGYLQIVKATLVTLDQIVSLDMHVCVPTFPFLKGDMQQASQSIGGGANDAFLKLKS